MAVSAKTVASELIRKIDGGQFDEKAAKALPVPDLKAVAAALVNNELPGRTFTGVKKDGSPTKRLTGIALGSLPRVLRERIEKEGILSPEGKLLK